MGLHNTAARYGSLARALHWLTVLMIFAIIPLGIVANDAAHAVRAPGATPDAQDLARAATLFSLHKTLGVAIFLLALLRVAWAAGQPKPRPLHPDRRIETWLADTVHWLLYGSILLVPLTGWVHHAATTGFAPILWPLGQSLPFVPKSEGLAALTAGLHVVLERVLVVAILLHVAGALKHHFIDRDATMRRMLPDRGDLAIPPDGHHPRLIAPLSALAVWAAALTIGGGLGLYTPADRPATADAAAPTLAPVLSDWQVEDGTLSITVTQLGSTVEGQFADWTAAIRFDEPTAPGPAGQVTVQVSIPSLTLGSVSAQALGPDFLDAERHATATYEAALFRRETGYVAEGTLDLNGKKMPLTLPFALTIDRDSATMTGQTTLDRRDHGIGDGMQDENTLAFAVQVSVALTARRGG